MMYTYEQALNYLEEKGIGCDPCSDLEGEYVCDLLDDMVDEYGDEEESYYEEDTLNEIINKVNTYREEIIQN